MAHSEDLPIYKACFDLLNDVILLTNTFPKSFRYGVGARMVDLCLDMMTLIYTINGSRDKLPLIVEMSNAHRMLMLLFRVCVQQRVITPARYSAYALKLDNIGRQLTGWRQYAEKGKT